MPFDFSHIDQDWTLFLDRDGVINVEKNEDYIRNWSEFEFYPESLKALPLLAKKFPRIIITTNQKGVGKGLMTEESLIEIHNNMRHQIEIVNGRIDHILYCTDLDNDSPNRKPQPGMAIQATALYPAIQLSKSIMVGNRMSDMLFGRNAGMHTVFLATTHPETSFPDPSIDDRFENLFEFTISLK